MSTTARSVIGWGAEFDSAPPMVSATLAIDEVSRQLRERGVDVLPTGFGQAGVPVHPLLRRALADAADRNGYGPVAGSAELRSAAAGYWERRGLPTAAGQVLTGPGSKALLYAVLQAVGGDVVVPQPSWVSYAAQASLLGHQPIYVRTPAGSGGVPDPALLADAVRHARAAGRHVRAVVLTLPDNPTGRLASAALVDRVCAVAADLDLLVISDEIYRDLVYDDEFRSPAETAPERVVITTGLSKSLALGGWRLGVARLPDGVLGERLGARMLAAASEIWSSAAQPVQHAAAVAFGEPAELTEYVGRARRLYQLISGEIAAVLDAAAIQVATPQAAFYLFADFGPHRERLAATRGVRTGEDLAAELLSRHHIAALPGSAFGEPPESLTLRLCAGMLTGADDTQRLQALSCEDPLRLPWIAAAIDRLGTAVADLTRRG